jgi:hypothetical protein
LHNGTVVYDGAIAHQNAVSQGTTMQYSAVANDHIIADGQRPSIWVEVGGMGDMEHGIVLYIGASTYFDAMHVPTNYRTRPHGGIVSKADVTDNRGLWIHIDPLAEFWANTAVGAN